MSSPIETLPAELFLGVVKHLRRHDMTQLMRVSTQYNKLMEPILWSKIELHRYWFHEHYTFRSLRAEEAASQRPYHQPAGISSWEELMRGTANKDRTIETLDIGQGKTADYFLKVFPGKTTEPRGERIERLATVVRWLCLPVHISYVGDYASESRNRGPWNAVAMFKNLEYLEISAYWRDRDEVEPFEAPDEPMSNLKTLKLRGHVPLEFVQYMCANASIITHLQLAVIDNPIGASNRTTRKNPPPPLDSDDEDAQGFEDEENVAPRPLACLTPQILSNFSALEELYLCRPAEGAYDGEDAYCEVYTSKKSDRKVLQEWAALLRGSRETLARITFDQRIVAEENAPDGRTSSEMMDGYCNGDGYKRFVEIVLPVLMEDGEWPALKSIRLFGFEVEDAANRERSVNLVAKFQKRFGEGVEILNGVGRWMLIDDDTGELQGRTPGDILDTYPDSESGDSDDDTAQ